LGKRGSKNDMLSTYMWKKKARREEEGSKESGKRQGQRNVEKIGTQKILEVEEGIWKKEVGKNASAKNLGPCYRVERRVLSMDSECS